MLADLNKNHFEPCLWLLKLDFLILNMVSICPYLTEMPNLTIEIFGVRVKSLSDQIKTDSHVILASFCKCFRRKLRKRVNNGKKCIIKTLKLQNRYALSQVHSAKDLESCIPNLGLQDHQKHAYAYIFFLVCTCAETYIFSIHFFACAESSQIFLNIGLFYTKNM